MVQAVPGGLRSFRMNLSRSGLALLSLACFLLTLFSAYQYLKIADLERRLDRVVESLLGVVEGHQAALREVHSSLDKHLGVLEQHNQVLETLAGGNRGGKKKEEP
jgi:hypothetical protein